MYRVSVYDEYGTKAMGRMFDTKEKAMYYVEGVVEALEAWRDVILNIEAAEPIYPRLDKGEMVVIADRNHLDSPKVSYRIYMYDANVHFQDPE